MRKILSILAVFLLIGSASAAVYITYNPEAKIWFSQDNPGYEGAGVVTYVEMSDSSWTNGITLTPDDDGVIANQLMFRNPTPSNITGEVIFTIECDQGIFMNMDGTVKDFDDILYLSPSNSAIKLNEVGHITVISPNIVEFDTGEFPDFLANDHLYGDIMIDLVPMAYGNYTCTVLVEAV